MDSASKSFLTVYLCAFIVSMAAPAYGMDNFEQEYLYDQDVDSGLAKQVGDSLRDRSSQVFDKIQSFFRFQEPTKESVEDVVQADNVIIEFVEASTGDIENNKAESAEIFESQDIDSEGALEEPIPLPDKQELIAQNFWIKAISGTAFVGLVAIIRYFLYVRGDSGSDQE